MTALYDTNTDDLRPYGDNPSTEWQATPLEKARAVRAVRGEARHAYTRALDSLRAADANLRSAYAQDELGYLAIRAKLSGRTDTPVNVSFRLPTAPDELTADQRVAMKGVLTLFPTDLSPGGKPIAPILARSRR